MLAKQLRALVVDDDPIARKTVGFALEQEDFICAFAADGAAALERIAAEPFDLVVTDLCMPNKHGHALVVELISRDQDLVIVVHSSVNDPRLTKDLIARGVDDIIYKPANYAAFAAKAKALVERRQRATAKPAPPAAATVDEPVAPSPAPVDTACPVSPISRADYERRLANVQHLFPLSSAAYDVFVLSNSGETNTGELVGTMLRDAALTADVLRLANSAFYSRDRRSTIDLEEAVMRIGYKKVGEVALALNALGAFRGCILPWLDAELGQARSLAASIALERLCESREFDTAHEGMTLCAFLHPLGRLVLGSAFQDEYQALIRATHERHASLNDLESQVFPESHTAALGRVLSHWNVPADIWEPLCHLGEPYESIARLEEPTRSRVESIKLAVFIGDVAVGRWMPWDQIESPPSHVLARRRLSTLAPIIERTKADLARVSDAHRLSNSQPAFGRLSPTGVEPKRRVLYTQIAGGKGDWMPLLLASLGIEVIYRDSGKGEDAKGILVDGLGAAPGDVADAGRRLQREGLKPLYLIAHDSASLADEYGPMLRFPLSVAALSASCERLAPSIRPGRTEDGLLTARGQAPLVDVLG